MEPVFVLPGDHIDPAFVPSHPKKPLRLGPGIRHVPPSDLVPTIAGQLIADRNKNAIRVETPNGRVGELVVGTVLRSAAEVYYVSLSDYTAPCLLPQLSFEGATKKTRPVLAPGSLVYARIAAADKHMDPELECVSAATGKADGLGPLAGGMLFDVSLGMAQALLAPRRAGSHEQARLVVLEELAAAGLRFDTATGRNGRVWVDGDGARTVITVGRALQQTDERRLGAEEQRKLARRLIKEMSG
ncbi:Exosome complex component RRP40 [Escovopsis weberi]|uniref:Exosome complex component RRP40 n=1 Tax=Escovopsis weberi TaxID=150374 RepID=A0A0M8MR54_ESCWE|nr:Exosome complex component RRP40 [Escovopsis weberi]